MDSPATTSTRFAWGFSFVILGILTACSTSPQHVQGGMEERPSLGASGENSLRERAETLWNARVAEDWATAFDFLDPVDREGVTAEDFAVWSSEKEPFHIHAYTISEVLTEGEMGWVEVDTVVSVRNFSKAGPRSAHRSEKWHRVDGEWIPVHPKKLDFVPESPRQRNLEEEKHLRQRIHEVWQARLDRNWDYLYRMCDPRDHDDVSFSTFIDAQEIVRHFSYEIIWVEVVGDRGRTRVAYRLELNDPSLTKLPREYLVGNESWVNYDGEWYLEMKRSEEDEAE